MKKITAILLMCVAISIASAESIETTKDVICDDKEELFAWLQTNEYQEKPTWVGDSPSSKTKLAVLTNNETGTWTIIEFNNKYACVVSVGVKSKLAPVRPTKKPI